MNKSKKTAKKNNAPKMKDLTAQQRRLAILKQKKCDAVALHIVSKLIDCPVEESVFLQCLKYLNQCHYQDIVEERAISKMCGYPICGKAIPNMPTKQFHISTKLNKVYDITDRKNYCSNYCYRAGTFIKEQMLTSPLWFRDKEEIPDFHFLSKTESGVPGQEIDQGIAKVDLSDNTQFTSVSKFTEEMMNDFSEDMCEKLNLECQTKEANDEKPTVEAEETDKKLGAQEGPSSSYLKGNSGEKNCYKKVEVAQKYDKTIEKVAGVDLKYFQFSTPTLAEILQENAEYFRDQHPENSGKKSFAQTVISTEITSDVNTEIFVENSQTKLDERNDNTAGNCSRSTLHVENNIEEDKTQYKRKAESSKDKISIGFDRTVINTLATTGSAENEKRTNEEKDEPKDIKENRGHVKSILSKSKIENKKSSEKKRVSFNIENDDNEEKDTRTKLRYEDKKFKKPVCYTNVNVIGSVQETTSIYKSETDSTHTSKQEVEKTNRNIIGTVRDRMGNNKLKEQETEKDTESNISSNPSSVKEEHQRIVVCNKDIIESSSSSKTIEIDNLETNISSTSLGVKKEYQGSVDSSEIKENIDTNVSLNSSNSSSSQKELTGKQIEPVTKLENVHIKDLEVALSVTENQDVTTPDAEENPSCSNNKSKRLNRLKESSAYKKAIQQKKFVPNEKVVDNSSPNNEEEILKEITEKDINNVDKILTEEMNEECQKHSVSAKEIEKNSVYHNGEKESKEIVEESHSNTEKVLTVNSGIFIEKTASVPTSENSNLRAIQPEISINKVNSQEISMHNQEKEIKQSETESQSSDQKQDSLDAVKSQEISVPSQKRNSSVSNNSSEKEKRLSRLKQSSAYKKATRVSKSSAEVTTQNETAKKNKENMASKLTKCVKEWCTLDTAIFLFGSEYVKEIMSEKQYKQYLNRKKNLDLNDAKQQQYDAICKQINMMELADRKFDESVTGKRRRPLPRYEELQKESEKMDLRVKAFYAGCYQVYEDDCESETESVKDEDEPFIAKGPPAVLPLIDSKDIIATRRKIFLTSLSRIIPTLCDILKESPNSLLSDLKKLIDTFEFTSKNIVFKTTEWQLVAVLLIKMLSLRDNHLKDSLQFQDVDLYIKSLCDYFEMSEQNAEDFLVSFIEIKLIIQDCITNNAM